MDIQQAESILNDQNVQNCAIVLAALDRLQAAGYPEMEVELHKIGQFSESTVLTAVDRALKAYTFIAIPGNGNGIKVNLSVFLRGLQLLHRDAQVQLSLNAVETLEIIDLR